LWLSYEEGPGGDKQPKAHAPQMTHDSLSTENTAAQEHANVTCGSKQDYGTEEKEHPSGNSTYWGLCSFEPIGHHDNSDHARKQKRTPVEKARFPLSPPMPLPPDRMLGCRRKRYAFRVS